MILTRVFLYFVHLYLCVFVIFTESLAIADEILNCIAILESQVTEKLSEPVFIKNLMLSRIISQRNLHFMNGTRANRTATPNITCHAVPSPLGRGQQSAAAGSIPMGREELLPSHSSGSDKHGRLRATSLPVFQLFYTPAFSQPLVAALPAAAGV